MFPGVSSWRGRDRCWPSSRTAVTQATSWRPLTATITMAGWPWKRAFSTSVRVPGRVPLVTRSTHPLSDRSAGSGGPVATWACRCSSRSSCWRSVARRKSVPLVTTWSLRSLDRRVRDGPAASPRSRARRRLGRGRGAADAAGAAADPAAAEARGAAARDAAQAVPARGEHHDGGRRGEHAHGRPAGNSIACVGRGLGARSRGLSPAARSGIISFRRFGGEHPSSRWATPSGMAGAGDGGEQGGDLGQLVAQRRRSARRRPGAPRCRAPTAPGDEPRAELGQDLGVRVVVILSAVQASPPCAGETRSVADRFPRRCAT